MCHPSVYSFLHVPVQSGSDSVLEAMNREYTVREFKTVVDTLNELVPGMTIATDIICGFPGETDEDFSQTVNLIKEYRFSQVHISQFYPRPGTPAARMKKVPSTVVKNRSRELTSVFESFNPYKGMEGQIEKIWITEIATDGIHLVGHTKGYVQVLVIAPESMLGTSTDVKITSVGRWSVFGEVLDFPEPPPPSTNPTAQTTLTAQTTSTNPTAQTTLTTLATSINNSCHNCMCSGEIEPCNIVLQSSQNCCKNICDNEVSPPDNTTDKVVKTGALRSKMLVSSISSQIRRRFQSDKKNNEHHSQSVDKQERNCISRLATFDWILLAGMFSSCVVIVALLVLSYS